MTDRTHRLRVAVNDIPSISDLIWSIPVMPIMDSLGLSKRIIVALRRGGVTDLDKLLAISRKDLSMIPGIGVGALKEIEARLADSHDPVVASVTAEIERVKAVIDARNERNEALEQRLEHLEVKRSLRIGGPVRSRQRKSKP